jgi:hypothetical protein
MGIEKCPQPSQLNAGQTQASHRPRKGNHRCRPNLRLAAASLGIGTHSTSALLFAAGDIPQRLRSEAAFAHLCRVSPIDASSRKQYRHRLNYSGERQANLALSHIAIIRMVYDPRTTSTSIDTPRKVSLNFRCLDIVPRTTHHNS